MSIIDKVAAILEHDHSSRNSDKRLFVIFAQKCGMNLSPEQIRIFYGMPSFETIRRRRQILQERGLYPADKAVNAKRYADFKAIRGGEIEAEADNVRLSM